MYGMGRYEILNPIGKGEFGSVFLVKHTNAKLHKKYGPLAIKRMECDSVVSANEFIMECLQISKLEHGNLIKYHECFIDAIEEAYIAICLVMQFGGKLSLENFLDIGLEDIKPEKKLFSETQLVDFIYQLMSGLCYLHENNFIHRDISPRNILISDTVAPIYRITDFGFAKKMDVEKMTGSFMGTVRYIAPELYLNVSYSFSVDVFSLGCIVYEIMSKNRTVNLALRLTNTTTFKDELKKEVLGMEGYSRDLKVLLLKMLEDSGKHRASSSELFREISEIKRKMDSPINSKTKKSGSLWKSWMKDSRNEIILTPVRKNYLSPRNFRKRVNSCPPSPAMISPEWKKGVKVNRDDSNIEQERRRFQEIHAKAINERTSHLNEHVRRFLTRSPTKPKKQLFD